MTVDDERSLVQAAVSGDMRAFERLYCQTKPVLLSAARRLVRDESEDLVQDTYARALSSIATFRGECRFATWLYRILTNRVLQIRRQTRLHPSVELIAEELEAPTQDLHVSIDVRRGLAALRPLDRRIVRRELEGFSCAEIAREEGLSTMNSTIRVRVSRAHRAMQLALKSPASSSSMASRQALRDRS
jgi:RNA polymerase sigma-70 factor, ECF subfamily